MVPYDMVQGGNKYQRTTAATEIEGRRRHRRDRRGETI